MTLFRDDLEVTFNGLVLMDPAGLLALTGPLAPGTNVLGRFTTSSLGDDAIRGGAVIPVISLDDGTYDVVVRLESDPSPFEDDIRIRTNGAFPLLVAERLVVADLATLWSWTGGADWFDVPAPPGTYAVTVNAYQGAEAYEFVLTPTDSLPPVTGDLNVRMALSD